MNEEKVMPLVALEINEDNSLIEKLDLIKDLFDVLHQSGITYCHWKSNAHLDASMTADTDLDILFDINQKEKLEALLHKLGFKLFKSINQKQYKDIEDFIGLDYASGKIVHLHAHFRLTMGEAYLKSYQLDIEDKILENRVFDETYGVYRTSPAFELILLYFRQALKIRMRDVLRMYLKKEINYTGNILNEYKWLKKRSTKEEVESILKSIFTNHHIIYKLVTDDFNRKQLLKLAVLIKKEFKSNRLYSPWKATILRWYREISIIVFRKLSRLLNRPIISQRINPRGGLVIAVIGADGSGKSTVIANLQSTFKKKLDIYKIYLGKGSSGRMSWQRRLLVGLKKNASIGKKEENREVKPKVAILKKKKFISILYECFLALIVAHEKYKGLKLVEAAKKKGMLIICDRFPQKQVLGFNDGPVLHEFYKSANPFLRIMSKIEARVYDYAEKNPPDLVFKLIADAKTIEARKPNGASLDVLEAKNEGVRKLTFAEGCCVFPIDAAQPLDKVLYNIKKMIWEAYL